LWIESVVHVQLRQNERILLRQLVILNSYKRLIEMNKSFLNDSHYTTVDCSEMCIGSVTIAS